jgi:protease I
MIFRKKTLRGKTVAVLAADGFERVELTIPCKALRRAGAKVHVISLHKGKIRSMNLTAPSGTVAVDHTVTDARPEDYDALLIPGGFVGPDFLRQSREARDFVRTFDQQGKPIATLCHGPWLLVSAEVASGRTLAAWPGVRDDIVHAGGTWRDQAVVRDRNWVSSRGPQDLMEFVPAMIELYADGQSSKEGQNEQAENPSHSRDGASSSTGGESASLTRSSSPQAEQPLAPALIAARAIPGSMFRTVLFAGMIAGLGMLAYRKLKS